MRSTQAKEKPAHLAVAGCGQKDISTTSRKYRMGAAMTAPRIAFASSLMWFSNVRENPELALRGSC